MLEQETGEITRILQSGEAADLEKLLPVVYDELRCVAANVFRNERSNHTLQPTALVHEAYLRLIKENEKISWQNRAHFFGIAARLMRQILVNYALAHKAGKRGGDQQFLTFDEEMSFSRFKTVEVLSLNEALEQLAAIDKRQAEIVELRFFGGLTYEETAEVLQIPVIRVRREWQTAKMWLYKRLTAT